MEMIIECDTLSEVKVRRKWWRIFIETAVGKCAEMKSKKKKYLGNQISRK